ncbi:nitroreductase family protein [Elusimicrobiota bacterium]
MVKKEEIVDPILLRRSVRKYESKPIPGDIIEYLLEAAMSAPSAGNEQPWHFMVINSRTILDKITEIHTRAPMLKEAPMAILVCCELALEKHKGFWVQDCSAATENILLAAKTKGLGSVWLGVYPRQERMEGLRKLLWIPENITPFSIIALGYPREEKPYQKRYISSKVKYNGW